MVLSVTICEQTLSNQFLVELTLNQTTSKQNRQATLHAPKCCHYNGQYSITWRTRSQAIARANQTWYEAVRNILVPLIFWCGQQEFSFWWFPKWGNVPVEVTLMAWLPVAPKR